MTNIDWDSMGDVPKVRTNIPQVSVELKLSTPRRGSEIADVIQDTYKDTKYQLAPGFEEGEKIGFRGKYPYENVAVRPATGGPIVGSEVYDTLTVEHTAWSKGWFREDEPDLARYLAKVEQVRDYLSSKLQ